ncbi:hypothetical protein BKA70DRAFT_1308060 [Coprinopsis sp. MPI-PUGE-AT-0042]|nr:hypothetical protein BKA70DRAFT_1308060 [Coprinopsis sp. MPI-PUGE-AT-0042]
MAFSFSSLPLELQAHIFELATDLDYTNAPNLSLVSRSATNWVHPRMFHTVAVQSPTTLRSIQLKPPEFLRLHVKRLCLSLHSISMEEARQILSIYTGVVDLAFWLAWPFESGGTTIDETLKTSLAHAISQLPLQRVELPYEQLLQIERGSLQTGSSLPGWCTTLTHLEVIYWSFSYTEEHLLIPLLQHLACLTHLCIAWAFFVPGVHEQLDIASFLELRPLLQVVLVESEQVSEDHTPISDIRIVYSSGSDKPVEEWENRGRSVSKWTLAEEEVARRRQLREKREGNSQGSALIGTV